MKSTILTRCSFNAEPFGDTIEIGWTLLFMLLEGIFFLGGMSIMLFKFPECLYPGKFDLVVGSLPQW